MAAFVIPNHNDTRFFNGPNGNSGAEQIAIQQGVTVILEQSGDAGSPGSLPLLYSDAEKVASISNISSSGGSRQRFSLTANNSGRAVLNGKDPSGSECVFPLSVIVGDYQHHTGMTVDLFAEKLGKSNDAFKIYTAQRILNGGNDSVGDALVDNTNIFDQQSPYNMGHYNKKLVCGSVVSDRGEELFGKGNVVWAPQIYYNPMPQAAGRPPRRDDLRYDSARMLRARTAIGNLLKQDKAVKVGCLHHPERQPAGPFPQPYQGGGHYVLIIGCNDQLDTFLYLDPWVGGSRLVYKGGINTSGSTECFYMGLFKSDASNPRGPVLRQDDSTFGSFDKDGFLEVINGPL
jgi:hypothetical protein